MKLKNQEKKKNKEKKERLKNALLRSIKILYYTETMKIYFG
jgi:hypothetical protein